MVPRARTSSSPLLAIVLAALPAACLPPARALPRADEWHLVQLAGKPAGYTQEVERDAPGGGTLSITRQKLVVRRAEQSIELEMAFEVEEKPSGDLTRLRVVQRLARNETVITGVVRGDRLELTSGEGADARRTEVPFDPRTIGPRALERLLREKLRKPGDS